MDENRYQMQLLFLGCLYAHPYSRDNLTKEQKVKIANDIEYQCYKFMLDDCQSKHIERQWNDININKYSSICSRLAINIDPTSSVGNDKLLLKILNEEVDICKLPTMSSIELYPESNQEILDELEFRNNQKVDKKISTEHKCWQCGEMQVTYEEKQFRASDEPATLCFECLNCGNQWRRNM